MGILGSILLWSMVVSADAQVVAFDFEDLHGNRGNTAGYDDWVVIYTVADRNSSDRLMAWQEEINLQVAEKYPEVRIARINIADVTAVPRLMRGVVEPILRRIDRRSTAALEEQFSDAGIPLDSERTQFFLVPDWTGEYLAHFGVSSGEQYSCWVAAGSRIMGTCHEAPDARERFLAAFDAAVEELAENVEKVGSE